MGVMNAVEAAIKQYGCTVHISGDGGSVHTRAFVEPLRYRNKIYVGGQMHTLGVLQREKYLYIGVPGCNLRENRSTVTANGSTYLVKRCETYYVNDRAVYEWGILVPAGKETEDDYDADIGAGG